MTSPGFDSIGMAPMGNDKCSGELFEDFEVISDDGVFEDISDSLAKCTTPGRLVPAVKRMVDSRLSLRRTDGGAMGGEEVVRELTWTADELGEVLDAEFK